ncbi:hypothetical protein GF356_10585 [candidate division GN15 bacterium]|nr:hypothetical protein [candidate division GN15 bacterium]
MPKRKAEIEYAKLGNKDCWHSFGLQALAPNKFASVVGKILRGRYSLVYSRFSERDTENTSPFRGIV